MGLHIILQQEFNDETFERIVCAGDWNELMESLDQILSEGTGDRGGLKIECLEPGFYRVSWKELHGTSRSVATVRNVST